MFCEKVSLFDTEGDEIRAALCVTAANELVLGANEVLSESELQKYHSFKIETGKMEFLLGRYSAKTAYCEVAQEKDLQDIKIANGIFGQPFFEDDGEFDLSISHSKGGGGAIVFDKAYPMGLDIENVENSATKMDVLRFVTKLEEIMKIGAGEEIALTVAWCMKEALAKAIRTGLTIPTDLLRLKGLGISKKHQDVFECYFENFSQYKGVARIVRNYVVAMVYPKLLMFMSRLFLNLDK